MNIVGKLTVFVVVAGIMSLGFSSCKDPETDPPPQTLRMPVSIALAKNALRMEISAPNPNGYFEGEILSDEDLTRPHPDNNNEPLLKGLALKITYSDGATEEVVFGDQPQLDSTAKEDGLKFQWDYREYVRIRFGAAYYDYPITILELKAVYINGFVGENLLSGMAKRYPVGKDILPTDLTIKAKYEKSDLRDLPTNLFSKNKDGEDRIKIKEVIGLSTRTDYEKYVLGEHQIYVEIPELDVTSLDNPPSDQTKSVYVLPIIFADPNSIDNIDDAAEADYTAIVSKSQGGPWIGKYEIPYELWYGVGKWAAERKEGTKYRFSNDLGTNAYGSFRTGKEGSSAPEPGGEPTVGGLQPVTYISWMDAVVWCNAYTELVAYFKGLENQNKIPRTDKLAPVSQCVYLEPNGTPLRDSFNRSFQIPSNFINTSRKGFRLPSSAEWAAAALAQEYPANIADADIGWFGKPAEGTQK
ncbi:MAG: SUMF1/EgtB/PvdO family nonheme iron enzyme, partial [Treponema sp.]|nr:SUMF1/EgtB/PvdO family nonheme iron enzyme [Treponema sp.]